MRNKQFKSCGILVSLLFFVFSSSLISFGNPEFYPEAENVILSENEKSEIIMKGFRNAFIENKGQLSSDEVQFYGSLSNFKIGFCKTK